ncbi:MAG TPA: AAA family ATPase [Bacteroidia bacterium]|jgi:cytidylate kinase|nr:AAA family ATPase [Bacteroidia bacterium]
MKTINKSVVIIGKICSGKSTLAKFIAENYSLPIISFGGYIKSHCIQNNLNTDRKTLQDVGESFINTDHKKFLKDAIAFSAGDKKNLAFEGVRHKLILNEIKETSENAVFIFVKADIETRYKRYVRRERDSDKLNSFEQFKESDSHSVEKEIDELEKSCDYVIDSALEEGENKEYIIQKLTGGVFKA